MQTHQALNGRVEVFKPSERLVGGPETDELVSAAKRLAATGKLALLIDLDDVTYINSLGLGAFTRMIAVASQAGGAVKICNIKGRVRELFDVVRFNILFEYHDSEDAALQAFAKEMTTKV